MHSVMKRMEAVGLASWVYSYVGCRNRKDILVYWRSIYQDIHRSCKIYWTHLLVISSYSVPSKVMYANVRCPEKAAHFKPFLL